LGVETGPGAPAAVTGEPLGPMSPARQPVTGRTPHSRPAGKCGSSTTGPPMGRLRRVPRRQRRARSRCALPNARSRVHPSMAVCSQPPANLAGPHAALPGGVRRRSPLARAAPTATSAACADRKNDGPGGKTSLARPVMPQSLCARCDQRRSTLGKGTAATRLPDPAALLRIAAARDACQQAAAALRDAVAAARQAGHPWSAVAAILAVSRQAGSSSPPSAGSPPSCWSPRRPSGGHRRNCCGP